MKTILKNYNQLIICFFLISNAFSQNFITIKHSGLSDGVMPIIVMSDSVLKIDANFKSNYLKIYNERKIPRDIYIYNVQLIKEDFNSTKSYCYGQLLEFVDSNVVNVNSKDKFGIIDVCIYSNHVLAKFVLFDSKEINEFLTGILNRLIELNSDPELVVKIENLYFQLNHKKYSEPIVKEE